MTEALLEVKNVSKTYKKRGLAVEALRDISFRLRQGEVFGVVGESGSGKSTLLRQICAMEKPDCGSIRLEGREITTLKAAAQRDLYASLQMVFQTPAASFDPRMTVRNSLYEPLLMLCGIKDKEALDRRARELMEMVGLRPELLDRFAFELSGGQCQRAAIARAVAVKPKLLLCDEVTSALDVSAQANVVKLLCDLSGRLGMGMVFVSHNIALVSNICQSCVVMHSGAVVESGAVESIIRQPTSAYTRRLISSVVI